MPTSIVIRQLGLQPYASVLQRMHQFTDTRTAETADELWVLQHQPVYTLGQAGDKSHILDAGDISVIQSDRGGQVTYHGPGQLVIYVLADLRRLNIGVRSLVSLIEDAVIALLAEYGVSSNSRRDAPGVYVGENKIAALGLRVRRGCSFHGLSLNIDMDLEPFSRINPCGYQGLGVTQLQDLIMSKDAGAVLDQVASVLTTILTDKLQHGNGEQKGAQ